MYERVEFMKQAGKAKIQNLVFPTENSNPNASTSRGSKDNSVNRMSNKLKMSQLSRVQSKESSLLKNTSGSHETIHSIKTPVNRCISSKVLKKVISTQKLDHDLSNPYKLQTANSSRNPETPSHMFSGKTTTMTTPSNLNGNKNHHHSELQSPNVRKRSNAASPMLDHTKNEVLVPSVCSK